MDPLYGMDSVQYAYCIYIREPLDRLTAKYFFTTSSDWLDMASDLFGIWQLHYGNVYLEI